VFDSPGDATARLTPELRRAIDAKCPKLRTARSGFSGAVSILLLEIADVALGNLFDLDAVIQGQLGTWGCEAPDHIWLVDTTDDPPSLLISKDRERTGEAVVDRFDPTGLTQVQPPQDEEAET
jgi:hypothetical protein